MEDQRLGLQGTRLLGRLHQGLRGCAYEDKHRLRALVYHSFKPEVVPRFGYFTDHCPADGRNGHAVAQTNCEPGRDSAGISSGGWLGEIGAEESGNIATQRGGYNNAISN